MEFDSLILLVSLVLTKDTTFGLEVVLMLTLKDIPFSSNSLVTQMAQ